MELQQALLQLWPGMEPLALSCFALAATLPLAWASWEWIEKPAMAFRHRLTQRAGKTMPSRSGGDHAVTSQRIKFGALAHSRRPAQPEKTEPVVQTRPPVSSYRRLAKGPVARTIRPIIP